MATWRDVYQLILDGHDAREIGNRLEVKPYRFRQLIRSPRLAERMEVVEELSLRLARWEANQRSRNAVWRLAGLIFEKDVCPETSRKAAMALIRLAKEGEKARQERLVQARLKRKERVAKGNRARGGMVTLQTLDSLGGQVSGERTCVPSERPRDHARTRRRSVHGHASVRRPNSRREENVTPSGKSVLGSVTMAPASPSGLPWGSSTCASAAQSAPCEVVPAGADGGPTDTLGAFRIVPSLSVARPEEITVTIVCQTNWDESGVAPEVSQTPVENEEPPPASGDFKDGPGLAMKPPAVGGMVTLPRQSVPVELALANKGRCLANASVTMHGRTASQCMVTPPSTRRTRASCKDNSAQELVPGERDHATPPGAVAAPFVATPALPQKEIEDLDPPTPEEIEYTNRLLNKDVGVCKGGIVYRRRKNGRRRHRSAIPLLVRRPWEDTA